MNNNQDIQEIKNYFINLTREQKILYLANIAHHITIRSRGDAYPNNNFEGDIKKLCAFNEISHLVTSHLLSLIECDEINIYPCEIFIDILFECAENRNILNALKESMKVKLFNKN